MKVINLISCVWGVLLESNQNKVFYSTELGKTGCHRYRNLIWLLVKVKVVACGTGMGRGL